MFFQKYFHLFNHNIILQSSNYFGPFGHFYRQIDRLIPARQLFQCGHRVQNHHHSLQISQGTASGVCQL